MVEDRRKRPPNRRLDSWKEIASYFGRDERTLKRWEKERGLPVRRLPGAHGGVYAFTDDLARWTEESSPGNAAPPASNSTQSRTTVAEIATSAVTAVCEPHVRVADQLGACLSNHFIAVHCA